MRIEQEEGAFTPQRTCAQNPKGTRLRQETDALAQRRYCTQAQKLACLHQKPHVHTQGSTCTYTKKYMNIYKEVHTLTKGTHALIQRSTCVWPRSGNACFEKHANTPREQMPLNMEVHAHTPRSTRTFARLWKWFSAPFDAKRIAVQVRYDARATREAVPPRAFERYLFWWLWTTEVTPKEKPPTRKTNEGMLTS